MFFSIIIPIYNNQEYIRDCLDSCLDQDLAAQEYEIICVNDGSKDSSLAILTEYAAKYSQIRVFSQENKGVSAARNVGLDHAVGEYIMFVDGDDLVQRNCLKALKDTVIRTGCSRLKFNAYSGNSAAAGSFKRGSSDQRALSPHPHEMMWMSIFKRSIIEKHHIRFVEGLAYYEDKLFLFDYQNACGDVSDYPEYIYFYRQHSASTTAEGRKKRLINKINSFITILDICSGKMTLPENNKRLYYELWRNQMVYCFRYIPGLPYRDRRAVLTRLKEIKPYLNAEKIDKKTIDVSLYRSIRRSAAFRHFEVIIYANALGAHLIVLRRKIVESKLRYICKHPRRFLKDPIGFNKALNKRFSPKRS